MISYDMPMVAGLSGRDPVKLLLAEAKRRPQIAELIHRLDDMSEDELQTVVVPMKWYRDALLRLKKLNGEASLAAAIAASLPDPVATVHVGTVLRYVGPDTEIKHKLAVPIRTGDLLYRDDMGLWLGTSFIGQAAIALEIVKSDVARHDYTAMISVMVEGKSATPWSIGR